MRLAVVSSHPIQYHAPLFREMARRLDLTVFFAHRATAADQSKAGFGVEFTWDVNLVEGYKHSFLKNDAKRPGIDRFGGCDTPDIGYHLRAGKFEAVLLLGWHLKSFLQGLFAAKQLALPVMVRGDSQLETPRSGIKSLAKVMLYPSFLRQFDAALYVGQRSRAYYERYHYPKSRLFFSPHCVDTEWFAMHATPHGGENLRAKHSIAADAKVVLFAGKLVPFKRPLDLIDAVGILRSRGCEVSIIVAGAGDLKDDMSRNAARLHVPLQHLGFCNQSEMPDVYAAANVLVLPSDGHETWGLVANEALACGRPVILSDAVGAAPDLVDGKGTGRIFPATDTAALAEAIDDVLSSPPSPQAIAIKSDAYSPAAAVDGVLAALENLRANVPS